MKNRFICGHLAHENSKRVAPRVAGCQTKSQNLPWDGSNFAYNLRDGKMSIDAEMQPSTVSL